MTIDQGFLLEVEFLHYTVRKEIPFEGSDSFYCSKEILLSVKTEAGGSRKYFFTIAMACKGLVAPSKWFSSINAAFDIILDSIDQTKN